MVSSSSTFVAVAANITRSVSKSSYVAGGTTTVDDTIAAATDSAFALKHQKIVMSPQVIEQF